MLAIPTNRPLIRVEHPDVVFRTEREKYDSVVQEIKDLHATGRPVLVGTISIEKSEHLGALLKRHGIRHVVLNAKYHEREAEIVAQAGRFGAVTIATNMAGRGTDIILGGVPDHRQKAILLEKLTERQQPVEAATDADRELALAQTLEEMAREYKKALAERKPTPEERVILAQRYVGLLASFAADHPSMSAIAPVAAGFPALHEYLEASKLLLRPVKERIARNFYPMGEKPVDFLEAHPLKAQLTAIALGPEFEKVGVFLDQNERERVVALGGLHILATERHEARRIDNQLRGRAGRQGDPGSSRFYLSLEDDLMRIFGSDRISGLMLKLGMEEGVPIEHGMVTKSIERAQRQVEAQNFAVRKHLLEYDDVMNKQRKAIYEMRRTILEGKNARDRVLALADEVLDWYLESYTPDSQEPDKWNVSGLQIALKETFGIEAPVDQLNTMGRVEMAETFRQRARTAYEEKERTIGAEAMVFHQRMIMLQIVDSQWKDHLYALDHLKEGIGLRGYGQRDPLIEYKKESYLMYQALTDRIDEEILRWVYLYEPVRRSEGEPEEEEGAAPPSAPAGPRSPRSGDGSTRRASEGSVEKPRPFKAPEPAPLPQRAAPRNLTFNDPSAVLSGPASARFGGGSGEAAEPREAQGGADAAVQTIRREGPKVGRNDPCTCGSGKKYKKCHGVNA